MQPYVKKKDFGPSYAVETYSQLVLSVPQMLGHRHQRKCGFTQWSPSERSTYTVEDGKTIFLSFCDSPGFILCSLLLREYCSVQSKNHVINNCKSLCKYQTLQKQLLISLPPMCRFIAYTHQIKPGKN